MGKGKGGGGLFGMSQSKAKIINPNEIGVKFRYWLTNAADSQLFNYLIT